MIDFLWGVKEEQGFKGNSKISNYEDWFACDQHWDKKKK